MSEEAVTTALRLIKEALFTFGAEGDECIQKLVSVEATLSANVPTTSRQNLFIAFYQGYTGADLATPSAAHEVGRMAARLNEHRRIESGLNVGPFDAPNLRWALVAAAQSLGT